MEENDLLTEWEAIERRVSCRAYQDRRLDEGTLEKLSAYVEELDRASGLHIQLITAEEPGTQAVKLASMMFSGPVYTCAVLPGGDDPLSAEKVGYYGHSLVLYATRLGLGTCWVAGTYDKKSVRAELAPDEKLWDVIPIGYAAEKTPARQRMIRASIRKQDRPLEQFVESELPFDQLPLWLRKAVEAVRMDPSAVNQQPVNIVYRESRVFARLWKSGHGLEYNDLGIAKRQFEAGAAAFGVHGHWDFGDNAEFSDIRTDR